MVMTEPKLPTSTPTTVQLAVPITDAGVLARLALVLQYAPRALAEVLGVELSGLLDQVGACHVTCRRCGAPHVECTLGDAPDDT